MAKGFDGLFLDAVDMIEVHRHRAQRAGMRKLVRALAGLTHGQGDLLFARTDSGGCGSSVYGSTSTVGTART